MVRNMFRNMFRNMWDWGVLFLETLWYAEWKDRPSDCRAFRALRFFLPNVDERINESIESFTVAEHAFITHTILQTGFACLCCFGGVGFGLLGFFGPADVCWKNGNNPIAKYVYRLALDTQCAICLEPLEQEHDLFRTPCQHCFHESCMGTWMNPSNPLRRIQCPLCRHPLLR
jgi:hypothetical protein